MNDAKRTGLLWSFIIFIILFISAGIYAIFLYMDLNEQRTAGFNETTNEVLKQTSITEISKIKRFNGEEAYHIVFGKNGAGEEKIIYYPLEGMEKTLTTIDAKDTMSETSIINNWQADCRECDLINVTPALLDGKLLWELVYYDEESRYVFDYRSIYDGSRYEEYGYLKMFN